jgi:hypothetical protein
MYPVDDTYPVDEGSTARSRSVADGPVVARLCISDPRHRRGTEGDLGYCCRYGSGLVHAAVRRSSRTEWLRKGVQRSDLGMPDRPRLQSGSMSRHERR